jgi:hypothetical protein
MGSSLCPGSPRATKRPVLSDESCIETNRAMELHSRLKSLNLLKIAVRHVHQYVVSLPSTCGAGQSPLVFTRRWLVGLSQFCARLLQGCRQPFDGISRETDDAVIVAALDAVCFAFKGQHCTLSLRRQLVTQLAVCSFSLRLFGCSRLQN